MTEQLGPQSLLLYATPALRDVPVVRYVCSPCEAVGAVVWRGGPGPCPGTSLECLDL